MLGKIGFWIAQPGLDAAYQQHFAELQRTRRAVADVATSRKRLELWITELERQAGTAHAVTGQLTHLRRQYADMQAKEERATAASRRLMAEINAFQTSRKAVQTAYAAATEAAQAVWTAASTTR
jgi:phage shock protein A